MKNVISSVRATYRILFFMLVILVYFISASLIYFFNKDISQRRKKLIFNTKFYSIFLTRAFNMNLICKNPIPDNEVSLLVGNHMGFIDIVSLQTLSPSSFVTSTEMRHTPVLGQICELAGCTYVNRGSRAHIQQELEGITQVLKQGTRVTLYPEAMASNGEQVLPFKKTLLMAGPISNHPIRPYVFNFRKVNNTGVTFQHRDSLCWYGDQTFQGALWRSLKLESIECEIEFLPLMYFSANEDRTTVSTSVHKVISDKFVAFKN